MPAEVPPEFQSEPEYSLWRNVARLFEDYADSPASFARVVTSITDEVIKSLTDVGDDSKAAETRAKAQLSALRESLYSEFQSRPKLRTEWRDVIAGELKQRISFLGFQLVARDASAVTPHDYQQLADGVLNAFVGESQCVNCGSTDVTMSDHIWCNACHIGVAPVAEALPSREF